MQSETGKNKTWNIVAQRHIPEWEKLNKKQKSSKLEQLKKCWKTLKDNYRRELKKQKQTRSGSGAKKSRVYCHFLDLQFLKPVMELRETECNVDSETEDEQDTKQQEDVADPPLSILSSI